MNWSRLLNPATNAPGLLAAAAVVYTAAVMIWNVAHHQGVFDPQEIVSAVTAVLAFATRQVVTPVSDPKDGNGKPLVPAPPLPPSVPVTPAAVTPVPQERQAF